MPTTYKRPAGQDRPGKGGPPRRRIAGERRPTSAAPTGAKGKVAKPKKKVTGTSGSTGSPKKTAEAAERPSRLLLVLAAVLVVAVAFEAVLLVRGELRIREQQQRAEEMDGALTAAPARAEKAANALLSYSHDSIDADIERTTPFLTPDYADKYTSTMRDVVADPAAQTEATVKAEVLSTGVVDAGPERTDVLVFVNQTTESTTADEPQTALNRAILTMVQRDGAWVVSDLKGL